MAFGGQENKRAKPRRNLYFYLKVVDSKTQEFLGRVVDLTTNGMLLINESPLETNSSRDATIILSGDLFDITMSSIEVSFSVQWSRPDVNPRYYLNGLKFKDLPAKTTRTIEQVIRKFSFEEEN